MRTWFPYPLLSAALFIMWLLLNQSVAPGSILIGLVLSTVLAWVTLKLQPKDRIFTVCGARPASVTASSPTSSARTSPSP